MEINPIAVVRTSFPEKFGIPRQSGLADDLRARIVFEPKYRNCDAVRGLDGFSHIWLIWEFSANKSSGGWQPVVRPPRLGGNRTVGVFASRSPFRPNPLGLSCVELESITYDPELGPVIVVKGADLMDGTPVYDIKPYIRYADSRPEASCGYVDDLPERGLEVVFPDGIHESIPDRATLSALEQVLSLDPRPSYHNDPHRVYGMSFSGYDIHFRVEGNLLIVIDAE